MDKTKDEPNYPDGEVWDVLCIPVLDDDVIEDSDVKTYYKGEVHGPWKTIRHVRLVYILDFLQIVWVLNLFLYGISVAQQRDYLIPLRSPFYLFHDIIS